MSSIHPIQHITIITERHAGLQGHHNRCGARRALIPEGSWRRILFSFALLTALFVCIAQFALLAQTAAALGVTPARSTIQYIPGGEARGSFGVVNLDGTPLRVQLGAEGLLAERVRFDTPTLDVAGTTATAAYSITFPLETPAPGDYPLRLYAQPAIDAGGISAFVRLAHTVTVRVPPAGSYLTLDVRHDETEGRVRLEATLHNVGTEDLRSVTTTITVVDGNRTIATSTAEHAQLLRGQRASVVALFGEEELPPGVYEARISATYDDKVAQATYPFGRGKPTLQLTDASRSLVVGELAQATLHVRNAWNRRVDDVWADIELVDSAQAVLRTGRTQVVTLDAAGEGELSGVLDLRAVPPQSGWLVVTFHIGDDRVVRSVPVVLLTREQAELERVTGVWALRLVIVGALVAAAAVVLLSTRRKRRRAIER